jgi:polyketide synthase PksJ
LFGLKLGLFPSPEKEFKEFWRLLNYPPFPMVYRLRGEHPNKEAHRLLEEFRKRAFVKTDEHDPELKDLKRRILAAFDVPVLDHLLASGQITAEDHREVQLQRENALKLEWDLQYIKQAEAPVRAAQHLNPADQQEHWPSELQEIFAQVKTGTLNADQLIAALSPAPEYV